MRAVANFPGESQPLAEREARRVDSCAIAEDGRRTLQSLTTLAFEVRNTTIDLETFIGEQVEQGPGRTLGIAVGVGYVLGGGLRSRLTTLFFDTATRIALSLVANEVATLLVPPNSPSRISGIPSKPQKERA